MAFTPTAMIEAILNVKIKKAIFLYSSPTLALMRDLGQEIAVVGRSNAGKSSLINAICQRRDLARTSKTPGQTRDAVVYEIFYTFKDISDRLILVDLPGFGYADMSKSEARKCEELVFSYVEQRTHLSLLMILLDIRRNIDDREKKLIAIAKKRKIPFLLILTKCDKIPLHRRKPMADSFIKDLSLSAGSITLHSSKDRELTDELRLLIINTYSSHEKFRLSANAE